MQLLFKDESLTGSVFHEIKVPVDRTTLTVRDIITARVTAEVTDYNRRLPSVFRGLVRPSEAEEVLDGYRLRQKDRPIDAEQQTYVALDAFRKRAFILLVDDRQADNLDEVVLLQSDTSISFVRITPLIGG